MTRGPDVYRVSSKPLLGIAARWAVGAWGGIGAPSLRAHLCKALRGEALAGAHLGIDPLKKALGIPMLPNA